MLNKFFKIQTHFSILLLTEKIMQMKNQLYTKSIISGEILDRLAQKHEIPDFIKDDPVQFPHRYSLKQHIEISAFISSAFAYGNRKKIIENLECIHKTINAAPYEFVINFDIDRDVELFRGFCYRFNREEDILFLFHSLKQILKQYDSLENAFLAGYSDNDKNIKNALVNFVALFGDSRLVPSPQKGSACKRLNLFLKWMVREGPVDLGVWKTIPKSKLIIPFDVHVSRISRLWGLTARKSNDWPAAEEITDNLKKFDPDDPVKYDFAIFGEGVEGNV